MESEIFGHEKGSFTGAVERRAGCFELAEEGTLLLDELGEMPIGTQAKLLRVLEERKLRRLGSHAPSRMSNVRVLAATNRDPELAVADGKLRSDLFYPAECVSHSYAAVAGASRGYSRYGRGDARGYEQEAWAECGGDLAD